MVIYSMIENDCNDILNLLSVISSSSQPNVEKNSQNILPLLCELRDTYNLYCYIKDEVIYNNITANNDAIVKRAGLLSTHAHLSLILTLCILSLEKNCSLKPDYQFDLFLSTLVIYLNEEKFYIKDLFNNFCSKNTLRLLAHRYEASKYNYPNTILNNIYISQTFVL